MDKFKAHSVAFCKCDRLMTAISDSNVMCSNPLCPERGKEYVMTTTFEEKESIEV